MTDRNRSRTAQGEDRGEEQDDPRGQGPQGTPGDQETPEDPADDTGEEQAAGGEEDLADDELVDDELDDLDDEPARPTRGSRRFQELTRRNEEMSRELAERRQRESQPLATGPREETDAEFNARLQMLDPEMRFEARMERAERVNAQRSYHLQIQMADSADRSSYQARAAYDKRYAKYADEVERRHEELRRGANGRPPQLVDREVLLKIIIGERVLGARGSKAGREQRRVREERVARNRTRPGAPRSDTASTRTAGGNESTARARRLADVPL